MAASLEQASLTKPKRKRKLLVGDNVEVRSMEEGFDGSWHPATVIECRDLVREVRYEHLLVDDGNENLTQLVSVPCTVDGIVPDVVIPVNYRGVIRPIPPAFKTPSYVWGFYFGLCVDVYYNDAWWEGVIFDHEDGSEERLVFFPDLGDEQLVEIKNLRLTHDWDEIGDSWSMRGNWLFLELIEELEKTMFVSVSMRQLWYDVRTKEAFRAGIKEWTCCVKSLWDDIVPEVIRDNMNLTAEHFLNVIQSGNSLNASVPCDGVLQDHAEENQLALIPSGPSKRTRSRSNTKFDITLPCEHILQAQKEENQRSLTSIAPSKGTRSRIRDSKLNDSQPAEAISQDHGEENQLALTSSSKAVMPDSVQNHVEEDQLPPTSVGETRLKRKTSSSDLPNETKKIKGPSEVEIGCNVGKSTALRFQILKDPNGCAMVNRENSEVTPIRKTMGSSSVDNLTEHGDGLQKAVTLGEVDVDPINQEGRVVQEGKQLSLGSDEPKHNRRKRQSYLDLNGKPWKLPGAENYPSAPINYLHRKVGNSPGCSARNMIELRNKVRMHLLYLGWEVKYIHDDNNTLRARYISPQKKIFYSLIEVCEYLTGTKKGCPELMKRVEDTSVQPLAITDGQAAFSETLEEHDDSEVEAGEVRGTSCLSESLTLEFPAEIVNVEPEVCPDAVVELYGLGPKPKNVGSLRQKAKKHLSAMGWKFKYIEKNKGRELRYISSNGKSYTSLRKACKGCIEEALTAGTRPNQGIVIDEESKSQLNYHNLSSAEISCSEKSRFSESGESEYGNLEVRTVWGPQKRQKENAFPFTPRSIRKYDFGTRSYPRQARTALAVPRSKIQRQTLNQSPGSQEKRKREITRVLTRKGENLDGSYPSRLRSSKRARKIKAPNPAHYAPRSILSWLIDNNVVLPREKVYCKGRNQRDPLAEGKITRDGIRCNCCHKVYCISNFEAHAGSTYRRPAASIFLEDGRSLLDCQKQMEQDIKSMGLMSEPYQRIKCNLAQVKNDYICSVCHDGGSLVLCDQCPSSFHQKCIGLESLPKGKWFCPSCRCGICGQSEFNGNIDQFTDKTVLYCDQCEREYHVGCFRKREKVKLSSCPKENWFCSRSCEKIFTGLHKLLGKSIPVGIDDLSWTVLKYSEDSSDRGASNRETMTELHSKLNVALAVMHECFEPIKEPETKDLVKDIIFNKRSVLKRLNFRGFYTVVLEKNEELISVATVRVYGEKVAEVPFVGTRFQFRRQGMCHILMNLLEKKLMELGVERLLLPAVPQILHVWTTSFGFSKMTDSERLKFLEYIFLDFHDATMCQKLLKTAPTLKVIGPRAIEHGFENGSNLSNEGIATNRGNLSQKTAKPYQQSDILKQTPVEVTAHADCSLIKTSPEPTSTKLWGKYEKWSSDDKQNEDKSSMGKECLKYYKRRKKLNCDPISPPVAPSQTALMNA